MLSWQEKVTEGSGWDTDSISGGFDGDDEESIDDDDEVGSEVGTFPRPPVQSWVWRELMDMCAI